MSKKIKVGNAEVNKADYDYFSLLYSKMPKEYVVADLVSKCEDYYRLFSSYQDLEVKLQQKENIIEEVRKYIKNIPDDEFVESEHFTELLEILDKENKDE